MTHKSGIATSRYRSGWLPLSVDIRSFASLSRYVNDGLHGGGVDIAVVVVGSCQVELQGEGLALSHVLGGVEGTGCARVARHRVRGVAVVDPNDYLSGLDRDGGGLEEVVAGRVLQHLHDGHVRRRGRWLCWRWGWGWRSRGWGWGGCRGGRGEYRAI